MSGGDIVLLCEDKLTDTFIRKFLSYRKFKHRHIRTVSIPKAGSGEQWVRENFPDQLKFIRQRQKAILIVVTDADNLSVDKRKSKLQEKCIDKRIPQLKKEDGVVQIIPRRNIETWLKYLSTDADVDESKDYKQDMQARNCRPLAKALYEMCHVKQKLRQPAPPSLNNACEEYKKFRWKD